MISNMAGWNFNALLTFAKAFVKSFWYFPFCGSLFLHSLFLPLPTLDFNFILENKYNSQKQQQQHTALKNKEIEEDDDDDDDFMLEGRLFEQKQAMKKNKIIKKWDL